MFIDILKKYNISAYRLSKDANIPYTTISELCTKKRTIDKCSSITLFKLSNYLKVSMDYLYKISTCDTPKIPDNFKNIFWDSNFDELDFYVNKFYIITRLITKGGYFGFKWVFDTYEKDDLYETTLKSRLWDNISANYMSNIFNIKKDNMEYYKWNKKAWR